MDIYIKDICPKLGGDSKCSECGLFVYDLRDMCKPCLELTLDLIDKSLEREELEQLEKLWN